MFLVCRYVIKEMQFGDVKNKKEGKLQLGYGLTCQVREAAKKFFFVDSPL